MQSRLTTRAGGVLIAIFLCGASAAAQGTRFSNSALRPTAALPGASVRVGTEAATGTPLSPLASIYSDKALTVLIASSIVTADSQGNYGYWAAPGCYQEQISAAGFSTYTQLVCQGPQSIQTNTQTVSFSATPTFNLNSGSFIRMTLTGNVTSSSVSNATAGSIAYFNICQDATGGRTFAWPASMLTPPIVGTAANFCTSVGFIYDGTNWRQLDDTQRCPVGAICVDGVKYATVAVAVSVANTLLRGAIVYDGRQGDLAVETGFTIGPGVTVILGAAQYGFSSKIRIKPGGNLYGQAPSANFATGTLVHQSGAIGNLIESFDTSGSTYWHDSRIENIRIDGTAGGSNPGAHGIHIYQAGQNSAIKNVWVSGMAAAGVKLDGNFVPFHMEDVSTFLNGTYGFDLDFGSLGGGNFATGLVMVNCGGDDNTLSLIRLINGNARSNFVATNLKSERNTDAAKTNPAILIDNFAGAITLVSPAFHTLAGLAGTPTGDAIKIQTTSIPQLQIIGGVANLYTNLLNDTINTRTLSLSETAIAYLAYANGYLEYETAGGATKNFYLSGSQDAINLRQFGDTNPRLALRANANLGFGPGNAAIDASISRAGVGQLATSLFYVKRLIANQGTTLVAGDFALSAGWGTTASVGSVRGTDQFFEFVVTSAGTGQGVNPTITHTPKDGTWTTAPIWNCDRQEFVSQPTVRFSLTTQTATSLVLTFNGTPVAAETFKVVCHTGGI